MSPTTVEEPTTTLSGQPRWTALDVPPVNSPKDEQFVTDYMNLAKAFQTKVKDFFKPHKDRAYAAWKGLCNSENEALGTAVQTEEACKRELGVYKRRCDEAVAAEKLRLEEKARKDEEERRINEAAALEQQASATPDLAEGFELRREAEAILEAPIDTPTVFVPKMEKAKGATYKDKWVTTGNDLAKFLRHLVAHPELIDRPEVIAVLAWDQTNLRRLGEMTKKEGAVYPGIYVNRETNVSGRTR